MKRLAYCAVLLIALLLLASCGDVPEPTSTPEPTAEPTAAATEPEATLSPEEQALADHYAEGKRLFDAGEYSRAIEEFEKAGGYGDAVELIRAAHYNMGAELLAYADYDGAISEFMSAASYSNAERLAEAFKMFSIAMVFIPSKSCIERLLLL